MVTLNKIYTKIGDDGTTRLATGACVDKSDPRVAAYGAVDEANAALGLVRMALQGHADAVVLDPILARIQNEMFDLGADLATPGPDEALGWTPLRILPGQVTRLEADIDLLNADLTPLDSFVLPGGSWASAWLHLARTATRRAEREASVLKRSPEPQVSDAAFHYLNRLSDLLFVMSRWVNDRGASDVKWVPGGTR